jgi:hypothetical protein
MPTEYAGYIPTANQIDWESLGAGLSSKIKAISDDRTARKAELDKSAFDLSSDIANTEMGESETFNNMLIKGVDKGRSQIKKWNDMLKAGQLSPVDYKLKLESLKDNWGILANSAKSFDARYQSTIARQQEDENGRIAGSTLELELGSRYGQLAELNGKALEIGDDGSVHMSKTNPVTGEVENLINLRDINRPENILDNRVIVTDNVASLTENWNPIELFKDLGRGGSTSIESMRNHPEFADMKAKVAQSVAPNSNPRAQLSVLTDNAGMTPLFYYNESDRKKVLDVAIKDQQEINRIAGKSSELSADQIKEIEFGLVEMRTTNGRIDPVLRADQQKASQDYVMSETEMQMGQKIAGQAKQQWASGGGSGSGGSGNSTDPNDFSLYQQITESWGQPGGAAALTAASGGKFVFAVRPNGGYEVYPAGAKEGTKPTIIKVQKDMAPYFFGSGTGAKGTTGTYPEYERQAKLYWSAKGGKGNTTTPKKFN